MTDICKNLFINILNFEMKHYYFYYYSINIWTSIPMVILLQCFKCVLQKILSQYEKSRLYVLKKYSMARKEIAKFLHTFHMKINMCYLFIIIFST